MNIKINILQNGSEKIYTTCYLHQNQDEDDIALLIAALNVSGSKYFFVQNERRLVDLIERFKINLDQVEIIKIKWIEDILNYTSDLKNACIFVFGFYRLQSEPNYSEPSSPFNDYKSKLILSEFHQNEKKHALLKYTILNNLSIYITEHEIPISVQIQDASGKFSIVSFVNGKKKEKECCAGSLGKGYNLQSVEQKSNEEIIKIAAKSLNDVVILYPSRDEQESEWYETDRLIDINRYDDLKIKSEYILGHFQDENLANEKVKFPNPIDENGESIPDHLLSAYDSKLAREGLKRHIPTLKEIQRKNSITAVKRYIEYKDSSLLLNDKVVREINRIISERFDKKKVEFLPIKENIFDLKNAIFLTPENTTIFILKFDRFIEYGSIDYEEYEDLWNWACHYKRNLTFTQKKKFNG
ncbi:MAG: hypothetical protein KF856_00210 [Cyclobacteriaceae bacterium]|nr:hypothetical protein [Cyclobacteriaceae bacterium]